MARRSPAGDTSVGQMIWGDGGPVTTALTIPRGPPFDFPVRWGYQVKAGHWWAIV